MVRRRLDSWAIFLMLYWIFLFLVLGSLVKSFLSVVETCVAGNGQCVRVNG